MVQLTREGVGRVRILIHVVRRKQRFLGVEAIRKISADGNERKDAAAELAEFPVHFPGGIDSGMIVPAGNLTGSGHTRNILLGKPHVVGEVAPVDGEQFLR